MASKTDTIHVRQAGRGTTLAEYWPLAALVLVSAAGGLALGTGAAPAGTRWGPAFMHGYMGLFLLVFALLKIFDLKGFRRGFRMYDLIARHVHADWSFVYPFIELALGLAYLGWWWPQATYLATILVFAFGAIGVLAGLRRGLDIDCPCMGTILRVPLSTVTLSEDGLMIVMAGMLLAGI
ncbi:MAG TPA: MauE/DoxX family redox-associated membrane protein [Sphingomonas sp.]